MLDIKPSQPICITPDIGNFTFGYYDRNPWDTNMLYHLSIKIPQQDHLPKQEEKAVVGIIDLLEDYRFIPLSETYAWNHQMGSMTMWLKNEPGCFIFNDAILQGDKWHYISRIYHIEKGEIRQLPRPVYCLSPDGMVSATLDFGRNYFRSGR